MHIRIIHLKVDCCWVVLESSTDGIFLERCVLAELDIATSSCPVSVTWFLSGPGRALWHAVRGSYISLSSNAAAVCYFRGNSSLIAITVKMFFRLYVDVYESASALCLCRFSTVIAVSIMPFCCYQYYCGFCCYDWYICIYIYIYTHRIGSFDKRYWPMDDVRLRPRCSSYSLLIVSLQRS